MCRNAALRAGHSLVELALMLLVMAAIAVSTAVVFRSQSRMTRMGSERVERQAAERFVAGILGWELRARAPGLDPLELGGDSVSVRAFRGMGIVCARTGTTAHARYRGLRSPDPAKDSLLLLAGRSAEQVRPLAAVSTTALSPCLARAGEDLIALSPDTTLLPGDLLLVFEHGVYHLSGAALRYRRGAGGRQPMTADVIYDDSSDLSLAQHFADTVAVNLRLATLAPGGAAAPGPVRRRRLALLNLNVPLDSLELQ
jgi:hypothetical protein